MRLIEKLGELFARTRAVQPKSSAMSAGVILAQVDLTPDPGEIDSTWVAGLNPAAQQIVAIVIEILQVASIIALVALLLMALFQMLSGNTRKMADTLKWGGLVAVVGVLVWTGLGLTIIDGFTDVVTAGA